MTTKKNLDCYEIQIDALEIYAYHGVFEEENKLGQRFLIDLNLKVSSKGEFILDSMDSVLSYADIVEKVHALFTNKSYNLLESVAKHILNELGDYGEMIEAKIKVTKVSPPIPYKLSGVSVILHKTY